MKKVFYVYLRSDSNYSRVIVLQDDKRPRVYSATMPSLLRLEKMANHPDAVVNVDFLTNCVSFYIPKR